MPESMLDKAPAADRGKLFWTVLAGFLLGGTWVCGSFGFATRQEESQAKIVVRLPENAKLYINGTPTKETGPDRKFVTPSLEPGKKYSYELKAEVPNLGMLLCQTEEVNFRAGQTVSVTFPDPVQEVVYRLAREDNADSKKAERAERAEKELANLMAAYKEAELDKDEHARKALAKRVEVSRKVLEEAVADSKKANEDLGYLMHLYEKWERNKDEQVWEALAKAVEDIVKKRGIQSTVRIKTVNNNSEEQSGLTVKYRFSGRKVEPKTTNSPAPVDLDIPIGWYCIWAERDGKPVSDQKSVFVISKKFEAVTLVVIGN
jgi:uncharacterized protein (TIGR03000 family)